MDYSIIIPVFNKVEFTRRCLETLQPVLEGAGVGEVIVVDNASTDDTPHVLAEFPWIRVIRNEVNLGFAGANNQAARVASGEFLILLNNDTESFPGWVASMLKTARETNAGIVGARLLFGDGTIQHAGVVAAGAFFSRQSFIPYHYLAGTAGGHSEVMKRADYQFVTGACMLTPRALYEELGGLDEAFWNGYEDIDYCFKVRKAGRRIVYDPGAALYHFESQSGAQRFRRNSWNSRTLVERWSGDVELDAVLRNLENGHIRRHDRSSRGGLAWQVMDTTVITVVVHSFEPPDRAEFERMVRRSVLPIGKIVWATGEDAYDLVRESTEIRGLRYVAFVDGRAELQEAWLEELLRQVEMTANTVAATCVPEVPLAEDVGILAADARCTLISLMYIPQHLVVRPLGDVNAMLADFLMRIVPLGRGSRGVGRTVAKVPEVGTSAEFEAEYGMKLSDIYTREALPVERVLRTWKPKPRGLVTIVMLSWNAPQFTRMALASIRDHTSEPYEVVLVDNGSGEETLQMLRTIDDPHVRIVYNATNRGFAGGNNDGIAAARGDYVLLLNNDVIVTEHWLDDLLDPFQRIPSLGVTAPRSNRIAGHQFVHNSMYADEHELAAYARTRRARWRKRGYVADRVIGFCMCIDRTVIDQVGGLDESFGMGNFEDDDYCVRVRAAGYKIYVCDDVFIHHFGSQSFQANNVDYTASMKENWAKFSTKWGFSDVTMEQGYEPRSAIYAGFNRARHFIPLPADRSVGAAERVVDTPIPRSRDLAFVVTVPDEDRWRVVSEFVKRYAQAFVAGDPVTLSIAALGDPTAEVMGRRVERMIEKLNLKIDDVADIEISDEDDDGWREGVEARRVIDIMELNDRSPSALRRVLSQVLA